LQVGACGPKGQAHVLEFKVQGHMFEFWSLGQPLKKKIDR
jgi:hypothetical protein